jgi:hypothetical protein
MKGRDSNEEEDTMQENVRPETVVANGTLESEVLNEGAPRVDGVRLAETGTRLMDSEVMIGFKNIKSAMVLSPRHPCPVEVEGLLVEHCRLPLAAHAEITMAVGDHEVVSEEFYLPTDRREEVMDADRKLADVNSEILVNENLRTRAMAVFYPDLSADYDLWYRIAIDETGLMTYALHVGPSDRQDIKKKIEGTIQL